MTNDAGDIARMLGERMSSLAPQLLRGTPWRTGDIWRWGSLAGEEGQSLAVWVAGPKRGRWREFDGDEGGDALDLVARTVCSGDLSEAIRWARGWLGLGELSDAERERAFERARAAAQRAEQDDRRRAERMAQNALAIWLAARPIEPGDVVWRYLDGRGIDLARLPKVPGALRCHPGLAHYAVRTDGKTRYRDATWPAMVAAIVGPVAGEDGTVRWRHLATQRTWLAPQSNGQVKKAYAGRDGKKSLGRFRHAGGAVHLTRGAGGLAWGKAPEGEIVALAEGIEDALSFAVLRPDIRVGAVAMSLGTLGTVALPPGCATVIVIAQNDPLGSQALREQARGIAALRAKGFDVGVFRPPVWVKDINEYQQWASAAPGAVEP